MIKYLLSAISILTATVGYSQPDTIIIGRGGYDGLSVTASDGDGGETMDESAFLPNENASSRFLTFAAIGHGESDVTEVMTMGYSDWVEAQMLLPRSFTLQDKTEEYRQYVIAQTSDNRTQNRYWRHAWWQYHMESNDYLRQRVAFALSQLLVISDESNFGSQGHALARHYDILLDNAFSNYRDLLEQITYTPTMGLYLTSLNNAKSDPSNNRFPDENYAREIMQLFSIGTVMLENDGTVITDGEDVPVSTYTNEDIEEFAKIFTGLTWGNREDFNRGALDFDSWIIDMQMMNDFHEPGEKTLLNGVVVPDRNPVDGMADIDDAIDNIFAHQNVPPFVSRFLIQRLVTANPSPQYIDRVANVFIDNGNGVRGDLGEVVKAILLDAEALSCDAQEDPYFGTLREPFIRYIHLMRAMNVSTLTGNHRNNMSRVYDGVRQRPLSSPTVFNFYQFDFQPIGPIEEEGLVAPVFQITDTETLRGYINLLHRWLYQGYVSEGHNIYNGEPEIAYENDIPFLDFQEGISLADDENVRQYLDKINMLLAAGRLSDANLDLIESMVTEIPVEDDEDRARRVQIAIYLLMTAPEYLITR